MKARERAPATYEDLLQVPDHMIAEILDGDLEVSPRPGMRHTRNASVMHGDLGGRFDEPPDGPGTSGGWWILFEPELHLGADLVVPDLAAWRRARLPIARQPPASRLATSPCARVPVTTPPPPGETASSFLPVRRARSGALAARRRGQEEEAQREGGRDSDRPVHRP